jgi:hypothetical protein
MDRSDAETRKQVFTLRERSLVPLAVIETAHVQQVHAMSSNRLLVRADVSNV